jgi:hypothetical protein
MTRLLSCPCKFVTSNYPGEAGFLTLAAPILPGRYRPPEKRKVGGLDLVAWGGFLAGNSSCGAAQQIASRRMAWSAIGLVGSCELLMGMIRIRRRTHRGDIPAGMADMFTGGAVSSIRQTRCERRCGRSRSPEVQACPAGTARARSMLAAYGCSPPRLKAAGCPMNCAATLAIGYCFSTTVVARPVLRRFEARYVWGEVHLAVACCVYLVCCHYLVPSWKPCEQLLVLVAEKITLRSLT